MADIFSHIFKKPQITNKQFDNCYVHGIQSSQFGPSSHSSAALNRGFFSFTSSNNNGNSGSHDHDHDHIHDQYEMNTLLIQDLETNMQILSQKLNELADELESFKILLRDNFLNLNGRILLLENNFSTNPANTFVLQVISNFPNFDPNIGNYDFSIIKT